MYFINTQLLGKDKLLTKGGDKKSFTFWQTVANTIAAAPEDFILIIDEAHRGAGVSERARKPIMQKFITGSERMASRRAAGTRDERDAAAIHRTARQLARTQRPVHISPEIVRKADCSKTSSSSPRTNRRRRKRPHASAKCGGALETLPRTLGSLLHQGEEKEIVKPVLVVQVQDGTRTR